MNSEQLEVISQNAIKAARKIVEFKPVYLDTETTGLGDDAQIVDIALIDFDGTELVNTLIRPTVPIPADAAKVHGITDENVSNAPTFADILANLEAYSDRLIVIYNRDYDLRLCQQSAEAVGVKAWSPAQTVCAMELYAEYYGAWNDWHGSFTWQSQAKAAYQMDIDIPADLHRAAADANLCRLIVEALAAEPLPEDKTRVILSSPLILEAGQFIAEIITADEAKQWLDQGPVTNYCGHQTVKLLSLDPSDTRSICLTYDEALSLKARARLEFGREYSAAEIEEIGVDYFLIRRIENETK